MRVDSMKRVSGLCTRINAKLICQHFDRQVFDAPFPGLSMRVKENVYPITADGIAPVQHFNRLGIVIARHNHFGSKWIPSVGRNECVSWFYLVAASCFSVSVSPTAASAGTIGRHPHFEFLHMNIEMPILS
jgi:hypothetical protein